MDERLVDLLCAPASHALLHMADSGELASINNRIRTRLIRNRDGSILETALDGALICSTERTCYPIRNGIPMLIAGEAFDWPNNP